MRKVKERFLSIDGNNLFTRFSPTDNIDIFVGHDERGRNAIKYRGKFTPIIGITSVVGIDVNQYENEEFNTLQFSLTCVDNKELFFAFCEDIIETTRVVNHKMDAYKAILDRYYSWKRMFTVKKEMLSESEIIGLIGELLFLRDYLFKKHGKEKSLKSWSGQEMTHKDFSYDDKWYEIKAIHSGKSSVKISSLEQLQSTNEGELVVFSLEKMSTSYDGINLNDLALHILNSLEFDAQKDLFLDSISSQGFAFNDSYNEFVYALISMTRYLVNSTFPKLTRDNVNKAILNLQYDLSLAILNDYVIKDK